MPKILIRSLSQFLCLTLLTMTAGIASGLTMDFTIQTGHGNTGISVDTHDEILALTAAHTAATVSQQFRIPEGGVRNVVSQTGKSVLALPEFIFRVHTSYGVSSIGVHAWDSSWAYSSLVAAIRVLKSEAVVMGDLKSIQLADGTQTPKLPMYSVTLKTGHGQSGFVVPGKSAEDVKMIVTIAAKIMKVGGGFESVEVSAKDACPL